MPKKERSERLEFKITRTSKQCWEYYKKYHYLNESIGTGHYYEITLNNKKVGFLAIARFPHPIAKDIMTISRIVIVPEFQGFGIGMKFMNEIANLYKGNRIRITTSLKPFMVALNKSKQWGCVRSGRINKLGENSKILGKNSKIRGENNSSNSYNRITATFQFKN